MILMGDLNTRMVEPRDKLEEELATALVDRDLVNMIDHFMTRQWCRGAGIWTCFMNQEGRQVIDGGGGGY